MIKPEQIPDEVCRAADNAWHSGLPKTDWQVAIAAAINAWPRACRIDFDDWVEMVEGEIVLPAPEKADG